MNVPIGAVGKKQEITNHTKREKYNKVETTGRVETIDASGKYICL